MSGSSSTIKTRCMPDILASHQKNHHLGNVSGMVANPLEMLRDENQFNGTRNGARVFQHVGQELAKDLLVEIVDDVVVQDDLFREIGIRVYERIQALFQNFLRCIAHNREIDQALQLRLLNQFHRTFRDVDRDVADALDVFDDLQCRRNESQIASNGLFQREDFIAGVVYRDFELVELV